MGGIATVITIDDAELRAGLLRLRDFGGEPLHHALDAIGEAMEDSSRLRFRIGAGPGGVPWKPSRRAQQTGGQTLVLMGRLRDTLTHNVLDTEDAVEWGSNMIYARAHQLGATIKPVTAKHLAFTGADGHLHFADSVTLPARPFIGVDADDRVEIDHILVGALQRALDGVGGAAAWM